MIADNLIPHEKRPLDALFTRWVTSATDAYIVMSESVEADLDRLAPGALKRRVPHPLYSQYASTLTREEARAPLGLQGDVVLFFGFVRHYKGLDTLLDAMPAILARRKVTLVVAGEFYEPVQATKERIERLGLGEHVRLYDRYLADEEVRRLFAAADVVIDFTALSKSGTVAPSSYTPFGILHVDDHRRMFFMVPVKFEFTGAHLETPESPGVIVDESARTLTTRVDRDVETLATALTNSGAAGSKFADAGLTIESNFAVAREGEAAIRITLKPAR
jgi:hypothetical protein